MKGVATTDSVVSGIKKNLLSIRNGLLAVTTKVLWTHRLPLLHWDWLVSRQGFKMERANVPFNFWPLVGLVLVHDDLASKGWA